MTRKIILLFIIALLCSPNLIQASFFTDSRIKKANALIKINRYQAAKEKLEEAILDKPAEPEIHYLAGIAYAKMGYGNKVDECFDNVYRLRANGYFKKIQDYYQNIAYATIKQGNLTTTTHYFKRSVFFGFDRQMLTENLMSFGNDYAANNYFDDAYKYYKVAYTIDRSVGGRISDIYFKACKESKKPCFNFFRHAHEFSTRHDVEIVKILLALYKTKGIVAHHKADIKQEIKFYVSNKTFKKLFPPPPPDFKIYPPGTYTFSLKAGETLDHWILLPNGVIPWVESRDDKFKLLYSDGEIVPVWTPGNLPNKNKFKFIAVTDQKEIKMIIK